MVEDNEDDKDFVEVIIDQTNTFYIRTRDTEEIEAPSDREMRDVLREAKNIAGAERLIIRAHVDALHSKVVKVLDTGNSVGMERIETVVTEVDYWPINIVSQSFISTHSINYSYVTRLPTK